MAHLSARKDVDYRANGKGTMSAVISDAVNLYAGGLVGLEGGYANEWDDNTADLFAGIVRTGDNYATASRYSAANAGKFTGDTDHANGAPRVTIEVGVTLTKLSSVLNAAGAALAATDVGKDVYCGKSDVDDMTLATTGHTHPIGWLSDFHSATDVEVTLYTPSEAAAQRLA